MARPLLLALLFLTPLAACDKAPGTGSGKQPAATGAPAGIPCALHGARAFGNGCSVERSTTQEGLVLILHHPDGGFRRLLVTTDGRSVDVIHLGTWTHGFGPDFRNAVISIDNGPAEHGSVELHLRTRGWMDHRHHLEAGVPVQELP